MEHVSIREIPVKKRLRFRDEDDLALLREVVGQNPYENASLWVTVQENILILTGKNFSIKTLKDHLDLLIKLWIEKMKTLKDKSGIEEEYSEKDQLLQNIHDYMIQFRGNATKLTKKNKVNLGKIERDRWANTSLTSEENNNYLMDASTEESEDPRLNPVSVNSIGVEDIVKQNEYIIEIPSDTTKCLENTPQKNKETNQEKYVSSNVLRPVRARKRKRNVQRQGLAYLEEYDRNQKDIKKQEQLLEEKRLALEEKKLLLEEKKLKLAEKKFYLEEFERKKNLEILEQRLLHEINQRKDINRIIERQDNILNILLSQNTQP